jgi:hypothetical protein
MDYKLLKYKVKKKEGRPIFPIFSRIAADQMVEPSPQRMGVLCCGFPSSMSSSPLARLVALESGLG